MTVALPIYNSFLPWLPLEGLARQQTARGWELVVMEYRAPHEMGYGMLADYWPRLQKAGCKRVLYMYTGRRVPLGQKWKEMAKRAWGDIFMLQAADDYPHPLRIESVNMKGDWYDTRYFYSYSLTEKKMMLFDRMSCEWKTGNDMATLTSKVKAIPDNTMNKGVDFYLFGKCCTKRVMDEAIYKGVNTDGANAISLTRRHHFRKPRPPFRKTDKQIWDIGLPLDIADRLRSYQSNGHMVRARLIKEFMHYRPGEQREFNMNTFNTLNLKGVVALEEKQSFEIMLS
jgi:hypothetical protein